MLLEVEICPLDFGIVLILILVCFIAVSILVQLAYADQGSPQISQCAPAETVNVTTVHGDGSIIVSTGSGSTVTINTCPQDGTEENYATEKQEHTPQTSSPNSQRHGLLSTTESTALVPVVPQLIGKPQRLNTKTQKTCRKFIDNLAQLSAKGKVAECRSTIAKLLREKTDPDSQVSLRHAASLNAINAGEFEKVIYRLLREVEAFLPETRHEAEHRLWWYHQKSLAKLRAGKYDMGIVLVKEALPLIDTVAPGCITAWLLTIHAWFLTEIAAGQDNDDDRRFLMQKAEKNYQHAMEHAEKEHPKQMLYSQSGVPQFAKIGLALLYLGCRESVENYRLGISDVSVDDIRKAKNVIAALEKEGTVCNSSKFRLMLAKSCLYFRLGSYQEAYDLALKAKAFATKHSFGGYVNFAESTLRYLQDYL